jgi:site-specific recombinase XerD
MESNPTRRLRNVKTARKLPVFLNLEEAEAILTASKDSKFPERDYAMMKLFLQTGCRLSELVGLELSQINLKEMYVRYLGKGSKERIVPLTESTSQAIRDYLAVRRPKTQSCKQVFLNNFGGAIAGESVQLYFKTICDKAGIEHKNLSIHKLRHTCFTLLLKAGVDIATIKEIAGHDDINTTSIYLHVTQNEVRAAMEKHPFR